MNEVKRKYIDYSRICDYCPKVECREGKCEKVKRSKNWRRGEK